MFKIIGILIIIAIIICVIYLFNRKENMGENEIMRDEALQLIDDYCNDMKNKIIEQYEQEK